MAAWKDSTPTGQVGSPDRRKPTSLLQINPWINTPGGAQNGGKDEHPNWTDHKVTTNGKGMMTTTATCSCSKTCKNSRGLKIHQVKMKIPHLMKRRRSWARNTAPRTSMRNNKLSQFSPWERSGSSGHKPAGRQCESSLTRTLTRYLKHERRCGQKATIISFAQERFGAEEKSAMQTPYMKNNRAAKIHHLGEKTDNSAWKEARWQAGLLKGGVRSTHEEHLKRPQQTNRVGPV